MGQARLPEMNLVIDNTWQQILSSGIDHLCQLLFCTGLPCSYRTNDSPPYQNKTVADDPLVYNLCVLNQVIIHAYALL